MTCEMCGEPVVSGEQFGPSGDYILCGDREACLDRMLAAAKAKTEGEPAEEDAAL